MTQRSTPRSRLIGGWLLAATLALAAASPAAAQARFDFDRTPGNLPKTVVPSHYVLQLDVDPEKDRFAGTAEITLRVREAQSAIVLHARELSATSVSLQPLDGATRRVREAAVAPGPINQSWTVTPNDTKPIAPGRYTLRIAYTGPVNRSGVGLFRAEQPTAQGPQRSLATQLESIDARNVFPSFDEPAFRAVFDVTVRAPRELSVYANMPVTSTRPDGEATVHRFAPTPPMPSYLMAIAVGRFDILSDQVAGVPLRILTAPGKREQARYAMAVTRQVVPYFNDYFGVPYALPKLDQQAVPSARSGAMEDWGLISYSEPTLLYDPARSGPGGQRRVFSVIAHEIAHQWFGNLVTAASWDEIWLNEAFATWMAHKATAHFNPTWQMSLERRLPIDETMVGDAGLATRAIRSGPVSENAVFDVFDNITYTKGGAVLSMLEQWIGEAAFRRGLSAYMKERRLSNATAGDLWHHMGRASGQDVAAVAASWTDQRGYPRVHVASACENGRTRVTLSQQRMLNGGASNDTPAALWRIPLRLMRGTQSSTVLLDRASQQIELPGCSETPLLANAGGVGYYRVAYEPAALQALTTHFTTLAPADQVTLLSDSFALAQAGELPMQRWLALVARVGEVDGPARATLFRVAIDGFEFLDDAFAGSPTQARVRQAARTLLAPELARLGWAERSSDDAQTIKLRGQLIEHLAQFDDAPTVAAALARFDAAEAGTAPLAPSLRAAVVHATGIHADRARFDQLLARLKGARGEEDRWLYATALAAGRDERRARELLDTALTPAVPPNIAMALPGLVGKHSPFSELAYSFALEHWNELARTAGHAMWGRYQLLPRAAQRFTDRSRGAKLIEDQRRLTGVDGSQPAQRAASHIALLAQVREREEPVLREALMQ